MIDITELTEQIKKEESEVLKRLETKDEGLTNYIKKFEERVARFMAHLSLQFTRNELLRLMGKENLKDLESILDNWSSSS